MRGFGSLLLTGRRAIGHRGCSERAPYESYHTDGHSVSRQQSMVLGDYWLHFRVLLLAGWLAMKGESRVLARVQPLALTDYIRPREILHVTARRPYFGAVLAAFINIVHGDRRAD